MGVAIKRTDIHKHSAQRDWLPEETLHQEHVLAILHAPQLQVAAFHTHATAPTWE